MPATLSLSLGEIWPSPETTCEGTMVKPAKAAEEVPKNFLRLIIFPEISEFILEWIFFGYY